MPFSPHVLVLFLASLVLSLAPTLVAGAVPAWCTEPSSLFLGVQTYPSRLDWGSHIAGAAPWSLTLDILSTNGVQWRVITNRLLPRDISHSVMDLHLVAIDIDPLAVNVGRAHTAASVLGLYMPDCQVINATRVNCTVPSSAGSRTVINTPIVDGGYLFRLAVENGIANFFDDLSSGSDTQNCRYSSTVGLTGLLSCGSSECLSKAANLPPVHLAVGVSPSSAGEGEDGAKYRYASKSLLQFEDFLTYFGYLVGVVFVLATVWLGSTVTHVLVVIVALAMPSELLYAVPATDAAIQFYNAVQERCCANEYRSQGPPSVTASALAGGVNTQQMALCALSTNAGSQGFLSSPISGALSASRYFRKGSADCGFGIDMDQGLGGRWVPFITPFAAAFRSSITPATATHTLHTPSSSAFCATAARDYRLYRTDDGQLLFVNASDTSNFSQTVAKSALGILASNIGLVILCICLVSFGAIALGCVISSREEKERRQQERDFEGYASKRSKVQSLRESDGTSGAAADTSGGTTNGDAARVRAFARVLVYMTAIAQNMHVWLSTGLVYGAVLVFSFPIVGSQAQGVPIAGGVVALLIALGSIFTTYRQTRNLKQHLFVQYRPWMSASRRARRNKKKTGRTLSPASTVTESDLRPDNPEAMDFDSASEDIDDESGDAATERDELRPELHVDIGWLRRVPPTLLPDGFWPDPSFSEVSKVCARAVFRASWRRFHSLMAPMGTSIAAFVSVIILTAAAAEDSALVSPSRSALGYIVSSFDAATRSVFDAALDGNAPQCQARRAPVAVAYFILGGYFCLFRSTRCFFTSLLLGIEHILVGVVLSALAAVTAPSSRGFAAAGRAGDFAVVAVYLLMVVVGVRCSHELLTALLERLYPPFVLLRARLIDEFVGVPLPYDADSVEITTLPVGDHNRIVAVKKDPLRPARSPRTSRTSNDVTGGVRPLPPSKHAPNPKAAANPNPTAKRRKDAANGGDQVADSEELQAARRLKKEAKAAARALKLQRRQERQAVGGEGATSPREVDGVQKPKRTKEERLEEKRARRRKQEEEQSKARPEPREAESGRTEPAPEVISNESSPVVNGHQ